MLERLRIYSEERDENVGLKPYSFIVIMEMVLFGGNLLCFETNAESGWWFLYGFATDNVAINLIELRILCLSLYLLFDFQDTVIYDRLAETSKYKEITLKHLEQFATEGECNIVIKHN